MQNRVLNVLPILVLLVTAVILFAHYQETAQLKKKAFKAMVLETQRQEKTELERLFDPVITTLSIVSRWLETELPELDDTAELNSRLMPVLQEIPHVLSAMIADSNGREYMLLRKGEDWVTRLSNMQDQDARSHWTRWTATGVSQEAWAETLDYDPRTRPWFRGTVDSGGQEAVFWTAPYSFFTTGHPGITAARKIPRTDNESEYMVAAFDILLTDISTLTVGLTSGDSRKTFILSADGRVIGVPDDPQFQLPSMIGSSVLTPAETFPVAMVRHAYDAWLSEGRTVGQPFTFRSDKEVWWASLSDYALDNELLWLAVAVPETDLVKRLGGPGYWVPATIIGIGMMLFLASLVVVRRFPKGFAGQGRPPGALDAALAGLNEAHSDLPGQVLTLISAGESEQLEFKSSVRWNFKAGRTGKEIELAWLKTVVAYLNSEGGIILLGVDDEGQILGLGKDGFANDDQALRHIENLVARHIGSAYFPYIRSRVIGVQGKKVLVIVCQVASKPVFLKHDKGEEFYVRTGPASRSLAPSEVLSYIEIRKNS